MSKIVGDETFDQFRGTATYIASEELKGMPLSEVGKLDADWMIDLLGIPVSATRRKCALLNLKVVRGAVTGDNGWPT